MALEFLDLVSSELRFNLTSADVDLDQLSPIVRNSVQIGAAGKELAVEIGILGASHFMRLSAERDDKAAQLTEVFACSEIVTKDQRHYCGPLGDSGAIELFEQSVLDNRFHYSFEAWTREWSDDGTQRAVEILAKQIKRCRDDFNSMRIGLEFEFPSKREDITEDQKPVTLVLLKADDPSGNLDLRTVHSYPNEGKVVFSRSILIPTNKE